MTETQPARRLKILLWLVLAWAVVVVGRLLFFQVTHRDELLLLAQRQQQKIAERPAQRGAILDRAGRPLAKTLMQRSIALHPRRIKDPWVTASLLAPLLNLNRGDVIAQIKDAKAHNRGFMWLKRDVALEEEASILSLGREEVETFDGWKRYYPQGNLAPQVVGTVGMLKPEDKVERGSSGIELSLDDELAGRAGEARLFTDGRRHVYETQTLLEPDQGLDVILTIDAQIQYAAQQALEAAGRFSGAEQGALVAIDPKTGQILAMASFPNFDPTKLVRKGEDATGRRNVAVSAPFEPGSVFKLITLAAALETTNLKPATIFGGITGSIQVGDKRIGDHIHTGTLSMAEILAQSSNVGAVQIGQAVGAPNLYEYIRRFGFGRKTNIELPGEEPGMVRRLQRWQKYSLPYVSIGHEVSITSLQMALAGAVIANGGMRVQPQLILARRRADGSEVRYPVSEGVRIIKPETAIQLRQMSEGVILHGTGRAAAIPGYYAGGKTGSAQIFDASTKGYSHHYNASFLGFAPLSDPRIVVAVTLIGTRNGEAGFGGAVAAPVFKEVASSALRLLNVPRDYTDPIALAKAARASKSAENISAENIGDVTQAAAPLLADTADHDDEAASQRQAPPLPSLASNFAAGEKAPDFRGKALRTVLEDAAALGIQVDVKGDGMARVQDPLPGSPLAPGAHVKVQFGR